MTPEIFLLLGDSLTEQGYGHDGGLGWVAKLSNTYIRRLSVINAGLGGYNTTMALRTLPLLVPCPSQAKIRFLAVWFGANDARLPGTLGPPQHVPLDLYRENLKAIVNHHKVKEHSPHIILITPPPIDEQMCEAHDRACGIDQVRRRAEITELYAKVVRELSKELNVALLDVWSVFVSRCGWTTANSIVGSKEVTMELKHDLGCLLNDGLHLTDEGNMLVYESLIRLIEETWPDKLPESMAFMLPRWDDAGAWEEL